MKIDLSYGSLSFESGTIDQRTVKQSFLQSAIGRNGKKPFVNGHYETYRIRPKRESPHCFFQVGDRLTGVLGSTCLLPEKEREWTEELEQERKKLHDALLLKQLGVPPYRYYLG